MREVKKMREGGGLTFMRRLFYPLFVVKQVIGIVRKFIVHNKMAEILMMMEFRLLIKGLTRVADKR